MKDWQTKTGAARRRAYKRLRAKAMARAERQRAGRRAHPQQCQDKYGNYLVYPVPNAMAEFRKFIEWRSMCRV